MGKWSYAAKRRLRETLRLKRLGLKNGKDIAVNTPEGMKSGFSMKSYQAGVEHGYDLATR